VAELRALKRMQETLTLEIERLQAEGLPDAAEHLTPLQRGRLERLAHMQGSIRSMWRTFVRNTLALPEEAFDEPEEGDEVWDDFEEVR
jgi:hypothetical protein